MPVLGGMIKVKYEFRTNKSRANFKKTSSN